MVIEERNPIGLSYPALERAMRENEISEETAVKVRELLLDEEVIGLYQLLQKSVKASPNWVKIEFRFFEILADVAGDPPSVVKKRLQEHCSFIEAERNPSASPALSTLLGVGSLPLGVDPRVGEGRLLRVEQGVEVRAAEVEWKKEDGVFVGAPHREHGCTIYHKDFVSQLGHEAVRQSLSGQKLYVAPNDVEGALWLIREFKLGKGQHLSVEGWRQRMERGCSREMSLSLTGVVLKLGIMDRPGELGNFARALSCCALETFQRQPAELLPLPLPEMNDEERSIEEAVHRCMKGDDDVGGARWIELRKETEKIGRKVWTWLQCLVVNFLYSQGSGHRMLTEGMLHSRTPTKAQQEALGRFSEMSRKWLEEDTGDSVKADTWENCSEGLGDMYTGPNIGKSYPLTLEAILPTTPGSGEAARIPMVDVVSDSVKPYVESPESLLIPEEELVAPRISAAVQVTSQQEWNKVVSHLVDAGMLEREVKEETLRYKDQPVRNGAFGVHKAWVLKEDGSWLRTLRLIINMIPANSFQRRMPVRASEKMGYAPLWGNLYLHDDEVIICSAEDQKHCFHIYRPGYSWRGLFTLNKKAAGECFKDGNDQMSYPRVKSAPMGWNNVVDFIQDGFENMAREAGLPPNQIIRMGEPSPLVPLETPRSFFSFYVDNFDQLKLVWRTDQGLYEGFPSEEQLKLREKMNQLTVGRDPKKAAEGTISWSSLGAEIAGKEGWVGSARSFRKALLGANLGLLVGGRSVPTHPACSLWFLRTCTRCSSAGNWPASSIGSMWK